MSSSGMVSTATLRYLGTSAQKARLVVDLIRGRDVAEALATLRFTKKAVAPEILRLLDSAVANAHQKKHDVDVDRLFVATAQVDGGPSLKRIRPAPMGRAFRVLKRMCHVTVALAERHAASPVAPAAKTSAPPDAAARRPSRRTPAAPRRKAGRATRTAKTAKRNAKRR